MPVINIIVLTLSLMCAVNGIVLAIMAMGLPQ
jgi:hypothetical protein